jgi:hypothetical protein
MARVSFQRAPGPRVQASAPCCGPAPALDVSGWHTLTAGMGSTCDDRGP